LLQGLTLLAGVTIVDVPSYVFTYSKPDKFPGDNPKGFSLTLVTGLWGVMVLL
jgi:hypothetical protein